MTKIFTQAFTTYFQPKATYVLVCMIPVYTHSFFQCVLNQHINTRWNKRIFLQGKQSVLPLIFTDSLSPSQSLPQRFLFQIKK